MTFVRSRWLFLRLLGVVYLLAFASLAIQITGLVGERGILPIGDLLSQVRGSYGNEAYRLLPTVVWLSASDAFLSGLCWAGAGLAILLIADVAPVLVLVCLWILYLSLAVAGRVFLNFQWDALLLETGLLACLYAPVRFRSRRDPEPNPVVRWVVWSLAFKLTFLSGITKILSGDPTWANLTALTFHYETQPIPTWMSWYAHQWPATLHYWSAAGMFAIELAAPFAAFLPARFRRTRLIACLSMIALQVGIGLTGNYGFFNLLAIVLYLALLDDGMLQWLSRLERRKLPPCPEPRAWRLATSSAAIAIAFVSVLAGIEEMQITGRARPWTEGTWAGSVLTWLSPFRSVNGYGLFRVMTTERPEIVIEVSADGRDWKEYEFRWKAGDPMRRPQFVEPHMPRLDWQMWFAALDPDAAGYWLQPLLQRILAGEPAVVRLLGPNPLKQRPRFARLVYYDYRFTTRAERAETGAWWKRAFKGFLTDPIAAR
jgi:hypothetical protein